MVLKFKAPQMVGEEKRWRFYEAQEVQGHTAERKHWDNGPKLMDVEYEEMFRQIPPLAEGQVSEPRSNQVYVVAFFDHNGDAREVATENEVYLLNNQGETIERLN